MLQLLALFMLIAWAVLGYGYFHRNAKAKPVFTCYLDAVTIGFVLMLIVTVLLLIALYLLATVFGYTH
jgi:RsiW-degrading membrane proteinase PrsW (M82 family)